MICPINDTGTTTGDGSITPAIAILDPSSGNIWDGDPWAITGRATKAFVVDANGDRHACEIDEMVGSNSVLFKEITGLPLGSTVFIMPFGDRSLIEPNGARLGTAVITVQLT